MIIQRPVFTWFWCPSNQLAHPIHNACMCWDTLFCANVIPLRQMNWDTTEVLDLLPAQWTDGQSHLRLQPNKQLRMYIRTCVTYVLGSLVAWPVLINAKVFGLLYFVHMQQTLLATAKMCWDPLLWIVYILACFPAGVHASFCNPGSLLANACLHSCTHTWRIGVQ